MRRILSVAATTVFLVACGDSFGIDGVSGTYDLKSVNGQELPYEETEVVDGITFTASITDGSVTLRSDNTWLFSITIQIAGGGTTITDTETASGTFSLEEPSTIRFTETGENETFVATWDGGRLTVTEDGETFVFEK